MLCHHVCKCNVFGDKVKITAYHNTNFFLDTFVYIASSVYFVLANRWEKNNKIKPEGTNKSIKEYSILDIAYHDSYRYKRETNFKINLNLLKHFNITMKNTL